MSKSTYRENNTKLHATIRTGVERKFVVQQVRWSYVQRENHNWKAGGADRTGRCLDCMRLFGLHVVSSGDVLNERSPYEDEHESIGKKCVFYPPRRHRRNLHQRCRSERNISNYVKINE